MGYQSAQIDPDLRFILVSQSRDIQQKNLETREPPYFRLKIQSVKSFYFKFILTDKSRYLYGYGIIRLFAPV